MKLKITFLLFFVTTTFFAQTLTISSSGDTGTSGTNWSSSGTNPVTITATNTAAINTSVIEGYLNAGASVTLQSSQDLVLANNIVVGVLPNDATLALKANKDIFINSNVFIDATQNSNINKLDIILHSDSDGTGYSNSCACSSSAGAIQINDGGGLKSNGGSIILGGGLDIITGSAWATGVSTDYTGINLINTTINSAGGAINMRSKGNHATGKSLGIMLNAGTNINSGSGKINIFGRSESFVGDNSGQFKNGIRFNGTSANPIIIMSSNTDSDAIILSGQEGYWTGNINTSGGSGSYREGLSFLYTNITATGGITFAADKQVYNNTTVLSTGGLNITSYESNSFWEDFIWNGTLSGLNFVGSSSIAGLTINDMANLGGLNLGKTTSISDITVNAEINIAGPITVYGDNIFSTANISTTTANDILLKAKGFVVMDPNADVTTNGGDIIFWSNTVNANSANENNEIILRGNNNLSTNGGNIILAGGLDDGINAGVANDNIPDGYAYRGYNDGIYGADFGSGIVLNSSVSGGGGHIIIRGSSFGAGVKNEGNFLINSGSGTITIDGKSTQDNGVEFSGDAIAITTNNTTSDAIKITGTTTGSGKYGVVLGSGGTTSRNTLIQATGVNGGITISGTSANSIGLYGTERGLLQVLAQSGEITLKGQNQSGSTGETDADFRNGVGDNNILFYLGNRKDATVVNGVTSSVTDSSSNINLQGDFFSWGTNEPVINTTGAFTVESVSNSFSTLQNARTSWFTFTNIGGLTIGKSTNVQNVTVNEPVNAGGDVTIYGKDIAIDENLNTSSVTEGDILLKASGNISTAADTAITTNGGDVVFWANSDDNEIGAIQLKNAGTNGGSVTTNGGDIILGGGADPLTDYAKANNTISDLDGQPYGGVWLRYASLNADGGNIIINGSNGSLGNVSTRGILSSETTIQTSGSGTITLNGDGGSASNATNAWGISTASTTLQTDSGDIYVYGISNSTSAGNERGMALGGYIQSLSGDIYIEDKTTSAINPNYTANFNGIYMPVSIGKGTLASSSSNVYIKGNEIQTENTTVIETTGDIEITPYTGEPTFTNTLTWNGANTGSKLTIGNTTNTADVILNANQITTDDSITIYGKDITINNKLEATNSTVTLDGSGAITDGTNGYVVANDIVLLDGAVTLDNTSNTVEIIAASNLDAINYLNAEALEIGSVGLENGITSVGAIDIATLTGDLTISQAITTQDISADAIILNAGKNEAVGTTTGGDIIVSGIPTISTGVNGIAKLFSGSDTTSAGLTTLVGGVLNTRFGVDETTTVFDPILVTDNVYALYRKSSTLSTDMFSNNTFKLYPNPIKSSEGKLLMSGMITLDEIAIYNMIGQRIPVKAYLFNNVYELVLPATLKSGMYIVKVTVDGKISQTKLLVE